MREEISAGGIVFRKTSVIPARHFKEASTLGVKAGIKGDGSRIRPFREGSPLVGKSGMTNIEVLISKHSGHHGWVFPKGHVGDKVEDETKEEAALREVQEETGVTGKILQPLSPIDYWYEFQKEKRHKTVFYFLMEYQKGDIQNHDWEMEEVEWLPLEEVEERLTYPGDKKVWKVALRAINRRLKAKDK